MNSPSQILSPEAESLDAQSFRCLVKDASDLHFPDEHGGFPPTSRSVLEYLQAGFPGLHQVTLRKSIGLFYNPEQFFRRGFYFATITELPEANFQQGKFQLNLGIGRDTFSKLFTQTQRRDVAEAPNTIFPHPNHGWLGWLSILNPTACMLREMQPLFEEAYLQAITKHDRRMPYV